MKLLVTSFTKTKNLLPSFRFLIGKSLCLLLILITEIVGDEHDHKVNSFNVNLLSYLLFLLFLEPLHSRD